MTELEDDVASMEMINGAQAARLIGVDVSTLSRWRKLNKGPMWFQEVGESNPRYRREDVIAYMRGIQHCGSQGRS